MTRKKLIAGNWKMNKTSADAVSLARDLVAAVGTAPEVEVVICPPFTALEAVAKAATISVLEDDETMGCIQIRAGFHAGKVVASVVGNANPRYCLFGCVRA